MRDDRHFEMLRSAWIAGEDAADGNGDALAAARVKFLRRKCCQGLEQDVCSAAFVSAVAIASAGERFRRSSCPHNSPKPSRRYELLMLLAQQLEAEFPSAEPMFVMAACRVLEEHWDR